MTTERRRGPSGDLVPFRRMSAAAAVSAVAIVMLPSDLQGLAFAVFGIGTLVAASIRVSRLPQRVRRPLGIIALAGLCSVSAGIVRGVHASVSGEAYPFPSPADVLYLCSYLLFISAILYIVKLRVRRPSGDALLDAMVGLLAAGLLQWTLVLIPYVRTAGIPPMQRTVNLTFSMLTLLMIGAAVLALVAGSTPTVSNRLLALGLVATFTTDIAAVMVSAGKLQANSEVYPAFFVIVFAGMGLMHPSVVHLIDQPTGDQLRRRLTRRRVTVLALALLTPPVLMLWAAIELSANSLVLLPAVTSLALTPLVVVRLGRLVRQNEEMAALEATLRGVGERLVSAETIDDVARIITVGAEQVLGDGFTSGGLALEPLSHAAGTEDSWSHHLLGELRTALGDELEYRSTAELVALPSDDPERYQVAGLVVVQRDVRAALLLVTSRRLSEDERNAVIALCRESAIALRAVEQTEQQVRQRSEDRFAALVDNSSDIVAVLDRGMQLNYVSPVAERLLGYGPEQIAELDVIDLVHRADRDAANRMLADIRFGLRESTEIRLRNASGDYQWFEMMGVDLSSDPNIGGVVLNAREIGDRKEAEEKLVLSEARFKALVQYSTDMVIVLDPRGDVRYASPSVHEVLGTEASDIMGRSLHHLFTNSDVGWNTQLQGRAPVPGALPDLLEFTFQRGGAEWRTIETSITDLRAEPAVGGFVLNARDVTDRKGMEQRLRYQATHDELTGLANRVQALEELEGMLARNSGSTTVAAILLGVDNFKDVNDSLGHASGDQLLNAVADRITGLLGFGDVAARVGGDEFVVVLERSHGESQVTDLADQALSAIAQPFEIDGRELTITASAGIVFDHDRSSTGEILLRNADLAMYRAKTLGKRQVVVFESQMHTASYDRLELRADLARAITAEQFRVHYQPVVDIETRRIVGAEALIRWEHPDRGMLGPNLFIPLAEETGLIGELGEWILERACNDLVRWRSDFGEPLMDFTISVNLSVQQLQEESIVTTVRDILERAGLPPERLVLEVTESTLITDTENIATRMRQLRDLGSRLAVDDFGTGYSSLGYIQQFEFDVLKIDKSFVDGLDTLTNQRIVTAVLDLARQLGVRTIAEGIETEPQAEILERLGCAYGQGYLYSRPVAESSFRELLAADRMSASGHATL